MAGFMSVATATLQRDVRLAFRQGGGWFQGIVFFIVFVTFMAFGLGPDAGGLRAAAPATLWLAGLFAIQLSAADMFVADLEDGVLPVLAVEQDSLLPYVAGKFLGLMMVVGLPLVLASPIILMAFSASTANLLAVLLVLTPGLVALGLAVLIASAINAALRGGGSFTAILAVPLSVPVLIFGVGAITEAIETGAVWGPEAQLMLAVTLFLLAIAPPFAALCLRMGLE